VQVQHPATGGPAAHHCSATFSGVPSSNVVASAKGLMLVFREREGGEVDGAAVVGRRGQVRRLSSVARMGLLR
jgi:hypothetical protein